MMINFERYELKNGLKVLLHQDKTTDIVAINVLYDVGARDEEKNKTGFAHLFEHLMFGGSQNIPKYDEPLERVGGENNAFTSNDMTCYYLTLPRQNIETGLWLESDRMMGLNFSQKSLDVQKSVVIEEFKQSYLNQPYGDAWALLRSLAYKVHPYKWQTIGRYLSHIKNAELQDVKDFFNKYYRPCNATLTIAGNIDFNNVLKLVEKWFGDIPAGTKPIRALPKEPPQRKARKKTIEAPVPFNKIYKAFHTCNRTDKAYHTVDLISDILSNGKSSRLYTHLVKKRKIFNNIDAYITGTIDNNLFVFEGTLNDGVSITEAEKAIDAETQKLKTKPVTSRELQKVKNKVEAMLEMSLIGISNKALLLAINELIDGNTETQSELRWYQNVTKNNILEESRKIFREENSSTLYYLKR